MGGINWPAGGALLPWGEKLKELLAGQALWQIWLTGQHRYVLLAASQQVELWENGGFAEPGLFLPLKENILACEAPGYEMISSSQAGPYPRTSSQASAFVEAFWYTRSTYGRDFVLDNVLYLPQLAFLLPVMKCDKNGEQEGALRTRTAVPSVQDEESSPDAWILGRWLSGGMDFPLTDQKRMQEYVPFVSEQMFQKFLDRFGWKVTQPRRMKVSAETENEKADLPETTHRGKRMEGEFCLPGRRMLEKFFREQVIDVVDREEEYRRMGILFPGPVLLAGPPGCGKTFAADALVHYLGWPSYSITSSSVGSSYIHETSRRIAEVFEKAMADAPSVVLMDEIEAFLSDRSGHHAAGSAHLEEVAEFLRLIPQLPEKKVLLIGMTNMADAIDPAILRKGRFDHILELELPDEEELQDLLTSLLENLPVQEGLPFHKVIPLLKGRPISDTAFAVREAGRLAVVRKKKAIDEALLLEACHSLKSQEKKPAHRIIGF